MTNKNNWRQGPRIFISHSSRDKAFIEKLISDFDTSNLRFWIDQREIDVGDSIPERISEGLISCDVFLLILSPFSVKSKWVQRELESAIIREIDDKDLKIIPVLISDCDIPLLLRSKRYADFRESYSSGFIQLLDGLHEIMEQMQSSEEQQVKSNASTESQNIARLLKNSSLPTNSFEGVTPESTEDGTILLAPKGIPTVNVAVIFQSTGEQFDICLPANLRCETAARRIVGEIFLKDLPILRRDAYLQRGVFYLAKLRDSSKTTEKTKTSSEFGMSYTEHPGFLSETLREAGIVDGDEVIVLTAIPYPWVHNASFAALLIKQREESIALDPKYRIFDYVLRLVNNRLNKRLLSLY